MSWLLLKQTTTSKTFWQITRIFLRLLLIIPDIWPIQVEPFFIKSHSLSIVIVCNLLDHPWRFLKSSFDCLSFLLCFVYSIFSLQITVFILFSDERSSLILNFIFRCWQVIIHSKSDNRSFHLIGYFYTVQCSPIWRMFLGHKFDIQDLCLPLRTPTSVKLVSFIHSMH